MTAISNVAGHCPMGCGSTLFIDAGGHVTCGSQLCPNPGAVDELLDQGREQEHVVHLGRTEFNLLHPLRERLGNALLACDLHKWIASQPGPPTALGVYRVKWRGDPHGAMWTYLREAT
jgi:hypothetical protein